MGASSSNESRYLYKIDEKLDMTQTRYYAVFEKSPFSSGAFRYCYKGELKDINNNTYGNCVVKVFKKKIARKSSDLSEDFKNSVYANSVANEFNNSQLGKNFYDLIFVIPWAASLEKYARFNLFGFISIRDDDSMAKIKQDEWLSIEPYLEGYYEKYVSNTNDTDPHIGKAIPAFMHWNWVYSKGEKVVSDIQGIEKKGYYHLTDPAVQSINGDFGLTDLGPYGILVFLANHEHNEYCINLPWPSDNIIDTLKSFHKVGNKRTTFSFEFKNYPNLRQFYINIKSTVFRN